jgi:uncharacterized membrane protein (GlpM family)
MLLQFSEGIGDTWKTHTGVWFCFSPLSAVFSFVFAYVLLTDDHVNNMSYFTFMSIKKIVPYFCVLPEGYYAIIWLIVRICVFIKDWKLIYGALFILTGKKCKTGNSPTLEGKISIVRWRDSSLLPVLDSIYLRNSLQIQYRFGIHDFWPWH